jgi:hypothetical protein
MIIFFVPPKSNSFKNHQIWVSILATQYLDAYKIWGVTKPTKVRDGFRPPSVSPVLNCYLGCPYIVKIICWLFVSEGLTKETLVLEFPFFNKGV